MKASDVDRSLSKGKLEKVLGAFVPSTPTLDKEKSRYRSRPVQRSPQGEALYARYQAEAADRKQQAESEKAWQVDTLATIREKWRLKRAEIEKSTLLKQNRRNLIQYARKKEAAELAEARARLQQEQTVPRYESWNDFLRRHAEQGDETALAVLRSRKQPVEVEGPPPAPKPPALAALKAEYAEKQLEVLHDTDQTRKGKKTLLAYLRMEELLKEGHGLNLRPEDVTRSVDNKGAVVFILPGGGKVRDTGKEVLFSGADELAVKVAEGYARKKQAGRVQFDREHLGFDVEIKKNPAHQCSAHER